MQRRSFCDDSMLTRKSQARHLSSIDFRDFPTTALESVCRCAHVVHEVRSMIQR